MLTNFIYAQTKDLFLEKLNAGEVLDEAIVFIEDTKEIWNHGHYFAGESIDPNAFAQLQTVVADLKEKSEESIIFLDESKITLPFGYIGADSQKYNCVPGLNDCGQIDGHYYGNVVVYLKVSYGTIFEERKISELTLSNPMRLQGGMIVVYAQNNHLFVENNTSSNFDVYFKGFYSHQTLPECFIPETVIHAITPITYSELKSLRDNSQLIPGRQYRITDYITTTTQKNTKSAGHQFDIIVTADDEKTLNEEARACLHEGDTYFSEAGANLAAWQIWYCLDNDTERFAWADATNGKGVIYYMKDEWSNECPYDFKNIQFARWELSNPVGYRNNYDFDNYEDNWIQESTPFDSLKTGFYGLNGSDNVFEYEYDEYNEYYKYKVEYTISESSTYCYTFGKDTDYSINGSHSSNVIKKYNSSNKIQLNNIVFLGKNCYSNSFGNSCYSNSFGNYCYSNIFGNYCHSNSFGNSCRSNSFGESCDYNSFGESCDYNSLGNECNGNSFGEECSYNSFGDECYSNNFGESCDYNSLSNNCYGNSLGEICYGNSLGNECYSNSFGNYCYSNSFGNSCRSNSLGNNCQQNSFGNNCYSNSFGNSCRSNSFGNFCYSNSLGNECNGNSFCEDCQQNSLGNYCYYNSFGNSCDSNSFGNSCSSNSFGNNCWYNRFGKYCSSNSFGNSCDYNIFGESKDNLKSYYCYITFDNGNSYINLNCTSTTSSSKYYQNVRIGLGVNNTTTYKTINDSNVGQKYETLYKPANSQTITI